MIKESSFLALEPNDDDDPSVDNGLSKYLNWSFDKPSELVI